MARNSLQNIMSLPDAAQAWNFNLTFPSVPGGGDSQKLSYKCQTTAIPGSKIEAVKIELAGVGKQEAGRAIYDHTFTATFLETVDWQTYLNFRAWRDYMRSWKNNSGTDSSTYKINLELDLFNNAPANGATLKLVGAFPLDITDINLEQASNAIFISMQFSFDYIDDNSNSF